MGSYIDHYLSLLQSSKRTFLCGTETHAKAEMKPSLCRIEDKSLQDILRQWSQFVVPLDASKPIRDYDRDCTVSLLFASYIESLVQDEFSRRLLRFDATSSAIRVHVP